MDINHEAKAAVNEMFYRNGPTPEDIKRDHAAIVEEIVSRYMWEAYNAGIQAALASESER